jgi:hypothetical protein
VSRVTSIASGSLVEAGQPPPNVRPGDDVRVVRDGVDPAGLVVDAAHLFVDDRPA